MKRRFIGVLGTVVLALGVAGSTITVTSVRAETRPLAIDAFQIKHELVLPGSPEEIYDAITGDLSGWWDHSFSGNPAKLYLEPKPGGGFLEIFDDSGDGVLHATVIAAVRGKLLRFDGPMGLSGNAIHMVHTYRFEASGNDSTRLTVEVNAAGQSDVGWDGAVDAAWKHFLFERFKPYVLEGKHKK